MTVLTMWQQQHRNACWEGHKLLCHHNSWSTKDFFLTYVCACVCVPSCVSPVLVYWQICPSSIRLNWPQWRRTLIYLALASRWSKRQPRHLSLSPTHTTNTDTQTHITPPYRTLVNVDGMWRNNKNSENNSAAAAVAGRRGRGTRFRGEWVGGCVRNYKRGAQILLNHTLISSVVQEYC